MKNFLNYQLIVLAFLCFFFNNSSFSQPSLDEEFVRKKWVDQKETTKEFRFRIYVVFEDEEHAASKEIQIINRKTNVVVQTIRNIDTQPSATKADELLHIVDANFDGYPDFTIFAADGGAGPNNTDYYYLFNKKTRRFIFDKQLSSLTQVAINLDKTITAASRGSCCSHSSETYRYKAGRLTKIYSREEAFSSNGKWIEITIGRFRNGKMYYTHTRKRVSVAAQ